MKLKQVREWLNDFDPLLNQLFRLIVIALLIATWLEARDAADQADDARRSASDAADYCRRLCVFGSVRLHFRYGSPIMKMSLQTTAAGLGGPD